MKMPLILDKHIGKQLVIELLPLKLKIYFLFEADATQVSRKPSGLIHATIRGTPIALLSQDIHAIHLEGDQLLIEDFYREFKLQNIDFEEYLSKIIGDIPAYGIFETFRKLRKISQNTISTLGYHIKDYLEEEKHYIVSKAEISDFCDAVDKLRNDTERLSARLKEMER